MRPTAVTVTACTAAPAAQAPPVSPSLCRVMYCQPSAIARWYPLTSKDHTSAPPRAAARTRLGEGLRTRHMARGRLRSEVKMHCRSGRVAGVRLPADLPGTSIPAQHQLHPHGRLTSAVQLQHKPCFASSAIGKRWPSFLLSCPFCKHCWRATEVDQHAGWADCREGKAFACHSALPYNDQRNIVEPAVASMSLLGLCRWRISSATFLLLPPPLARHTCR